MNSDFEGVILKAKKKAARQKAAKSLKPF